MSTSAQDTTILVVDDDQSLRSALSEFLENEDWVTLVVSDGADALRIVESYPEDIDLLVTDVMMAGMNGFTLAAQVAAERPNIKILYMSGRFIDSDRVRQALREAGRFFLAKPFGRSDFVGMVKMALSRSVDPSDAFAVILGKIPSSRRRRPLWAPIPARNVVPATRCSWGSAIGGSGCRTGSLVRPAISVAAESSSTPVHRFQTRPRWPTIQASTCGWSCRFLARGVPRLWRWAA